MTTATPPRTNPRDTGRAGEQRAGTVVSAASMSGWYDPDGAAWEADPVEAFEAFEARRASSRPAGTSRGADRER